jgi:hypothetical protein
MIIQGKESLEELGILDGINEVIATTEKDGRINAAPLGIIRDGDKLYIRLFAGTHTYENILANGWFVANVTHDAWLFAETALEDLAPGHFTYRDGLPVLKEAETWALFEVRAYPLDIVIGNIEFVKGEIQRKDFRAVNRGANLVIEAAVAATRYLALRTDSYYDEIIKLKRIVDRCGGRRERDAMERLMYRIDNYSHI